MELENLKVENLQTGNIVASDDLEAKDDLFVGDDANIGGDINLKSGAKIVCEGTGTNGIVLKNLKNTTGTLSGTAKVIEIDIEGTPYYFSVYPTKA